MQMCSPGVMLGRKNERRCCLFDLNITHLFSSAFLANFFLNFAFSKSFPIYFFSIACIARAAARRVSALPLYLRLREDEPPPQGGTTLVFTRGLAGEVSSAWP